MKQLLISFVLASCLLSCKTNRIAKGERTGLWIETDTIAGNVYITRGRYKKGMEVGRWRHLSNNQIVRTEKYKDSLCLTTFYHSNGVKRLQGKAQLVLDGDYLHWFYTGQWNEYDEAGTLIDVKNYTKGQLSTAEQTQDNLQN